MTDQPKEPPTFERCVHCGRRSLAKLGVCFDCLMGRPHKPRGPKGKKTA